MTPRVGVKTTLTMGRTFGALVPKQEPLSILAFEPIRVSSSLDRRGHSRDSNFTEVRSLTPDSRRLVS